MNRRRFGELNPSSASQPSAASRQRRVAPWADVQSANGTLSDLNWPPTVTVQIPGCQPVLVKLGPNCTTLEEYASALLQIINQSKGKQLGLQLDEQIVFVLSAVFEDKTALACYDIALNPEFHYTFCFKPIEPDEVQPTVVPEQFEELANKVAELAKETVELKSLVENQVNTVQERARTIGSQEIAPDFPPPIIAETESIPGDEEMNHPQAQQENHGQMDIWAESVAGEEQKEVESRCRSVGSVETARVEEDGWAESIGEEEEVVGPSAIDKPPLPISRNKGCESVIDTIFNIQMEPRNVPVKALRGEEQKQRAQAVQNGGKSFLESIERPWQQQRRAEHEQKHNNTQSSTYEEIRLRPYQRELATEAAERKNVIICAPTGSGKTIVGAHIIKKHLLSAMEQGRYAKVCFIVPTNALVDQQKRLFHRYLGHFAKVRGLSGAAKSMSNPVKSTIEDADLIVITPQLLLNELKSLPVDTGETFQPFSITKFTLIIFDESHHSKDGHPYNDLMAHYHQLKQNGAPKLPQIIGMTASLGIGGSNSRNLEEAVQYTLETCANMDAQWISCVREQREDLRLYIPLVLEEIIYVEQAHEHDPFLAIILEKIELLKGLMNQVPEVVKHAELFQQVNDQNNRDPSMPSFENWLCVLKQSLKTTQQLTDASRARLNFFVDQLLIFYYAINFLNLFGQQTALAYIKGREETEMLDLNVAREFVGQIRQWISHLRMIVQGKEERRRNSALLDRLISTLNDQFKRKEDSRVLIFLKKRVQCEMLSSLLNRQIQRHRTDFLTGQSSQEESGQNMEMQKAKLRDFSDGAIKVLCATTVAEEGIDITKCNLIVHYNYVTNEISRVQRRGRGRAQDARSILLTYEKCIKDKEEQNELREKLMNQALDVLARWPRAQFQQKVLSLVRELNEKRKEKETLERQKQSILREMGHLYRILCSTCGQFLGFSSAIALIGSTYVIADKDFWVRTSGDASPMPPERAESRECRGSAPHVGEHRCKCNEKLGRIVQYKEGILLPNLSVEKIVFIRCLGIEQNHPVNNENEQLRVVKRKWAKVTKDLFHVGELTTSQLVEMKNAPGMPRGLLRVERMD